MAEAEHLLGRDEFVSHDSDNGRHEDGNDALHRIEESDFGAQAYGDQITSH